MSDELMEAHGCLSAVSAVHRRRIRSRRRRRTAASQYGRVVYTHGPGLVAPLALVRMDYSDSLRTPQSVVLHNDWRGEYDIGSYAGGSLAKPCVDLTRQSGFQVVIPDGQISDYPKFRGALTTSWQHCVEVEWPSPHVWVTRETRNRSLAGPVAWMGTLIDGMRDNSGQMYMRNRYYDPASGRFTQEDPIGLAGGLNAYGFAGGDPVSYGDAFGLHTCQDIRKNIVTRVRSLNKRISSGNTNNVVQVLVE
jgi:RHS repeat-associated protein